VGNTHARAEATTQVAQARVPVVVIGPPVIGDVVATLVTVPLPPLLPPWRALLKAALTVMLGFVPPVKVAVTM